MTISASSSASAIEPNLSNLASIASIKRSRTAVNLLDKAGNLTALSETLCMNSKKEESSNNESCFAKKGFFSIDNKNAMNLPKVMHPDRTLYYVDQIYKSADSSGKEFYYATYKILLQILPVNLSGDDTPH